MVVLGLVNIHFNCTYHSNDLTNDNNTSPWVAFVVRRMYRRRKNAPVCTYTVTKGFVIKSLTVVVAVSVTASTLAERPPTRVCIASDELNDVNCLLAQLRDGTLVRSCLRAVQIHLVHYSTDGSRSEVTYDRDCNGCL